MRFAPACRKALSWIVGGLREPEKSKAPSIPVTTAPQAEYLQTSNRPQNTVDGCHDRAAADLRNAATSTNRKERKELRLSAERWTRRGDTLERIVKSFRKRVLLDEASREYRRRDRLPAER
jgi:hypothetical protein